jgi:hypothetical protein
MWVATCGAAVVLVAGALLAGCRDGEAPQSELPRAPETARVTSPAVGEGQAIPQRFSCGGENVSPPLAFLDVPPRAREPRRSGQAVLPSQPSGRTVPALPIPLGLTARRRLKGMSSSANMATARSAAPRMYQGQEPM